MKKNEYPGWDMFSAAYVDCSGKGYFIGFIERHKPNPHFTSNIYFLDKNEHNKEFDDFVTFIEEIDDDFKSFQYVKKCEDEWRQWITKNLPPEVFHLIKFAEQPTTIYTIPKKFQHFVPEENQHLFSFKDKI